MANQAAVDAGIAFIKADVPTALTGIYYKDGSSYEKGATKTVELVEKAGKDSALSMVAGVGAALAVSALMF